MFSHCLPSSTMMTFLPLRSKFLFLLGFGSVRLDPVTRRTFRRDRRRECLLPLPPSQPCRIPRPFMIVTNYGSLLPDAGTTLGSPRFFAVASVFPIQGLSRAFVIYKERLSPVLALEETPEFLGSSLLSVLLPFPCNDLGLQADLPHVQGCELFLF